MPRLAHLTTTRSKALFLPSMGNEKSNSGLVIKNTGSWYTVKTNAGETVECRIRGNFRIKGIRSTNPVTVGDNVDFILGKEGKGMITNIHDRKNYLMRRSSNLSKKSHIIATNIDIAILIASINYPETSTTFIDRFLATAEAYNINAAIVFNKIDLLNASELEKLQSWMDLYNSIGYTSFGISVKNKTNLQQIKDLIHNNIALFSGHSGVGKSSLINVLTPGAALKTGEISQYHKSGKHTTTFSEMIEIPNGGYIIDTPGIRGFGTVDFVTEEIYHFFPEIFKIAEKCRFHNCLHLNEPGCAVKQAVETGEIAVSRYASYFSILEDPEDTKYRV